MEKWIARLKYPRAGLAGIDPAPAAVAGEWILRAARRLDRRAICDAIVAVPLHARRQRSRGFNPAALLATRLARARGVPELRGAVFRSRDTRSQTRLSREARDDNVRDAFAIRPGSRLPARLWLVDDVATTGATLESVARTLHRAGVEEIAAVVLARTQLPSRSSRAGS